MGSGKWSPQTTTSSCKTGMGFTLGQGFYTRQAPLLGFFIKKTNKAIDKLHLLTTAVL